MPRIAQASSRGKEYVTDTGEVLCDRSRKGHERPWAQRKCENQRLAVLYEKAIDGDFVFMTKKRLETLRGCGNALGFEEDENGIKILKAARFCRVRLCPICLWRRSLKLFAQTSKIMTAMLDDEPTTKVLFVTLTVRNVDAHKLSDTIDELNRAFARLAGKGKNQRMAKPFLDSMLGYMRSIEVTYNLARDDYHPHIHALFAVRASYFTRNYLAKKAWIELWKKCLGVDYEPSVDVRTVKATPKAVAEVGKYPTKVASVLQIKEDAIAVRVLAVLHDALYNRRLVTFGGNFRAYHHELNLDDVEDGDLIHLNDEDAENEEEAEVQYIFDWRPELKKYVC